MKQSRYLLHRIGHTPYNQGMHGQIWSTAFSNIFIGKKPVKVSKTVVQSAISLAPLLIDVVAGQANPLDINKGAFNLSTGKYYS
ncbi:MAG: hypothetical protein N2511_08710 [Thermodesulfovibrionales bacterium]|nr:hypothetical protein [Thermodesulfovibrionales bacterium]